MAGSAYHLAGEFFELCDCYTVCPCWVGQAPTDNRCTGAFGWSITEGSIGDLDMAGRKVVSLSYHAGHRETASQEVYVFVDEGASDDQFDVLLATFTGQGGGPLGELARIMGFLKGSERAPIDLANNGRYATITVGRVVSGDAEMLVGPDDEITELHHGRLTHVLGSPAEVGKSSDFTVGLPIQGFGLAVTGRAAMRGTFSYSYDGEDEA